MTKCDITLSGKRLLVRTPFHPVTLEILKRLDPRRKWEPPPIQAWSYPADGLVLEGLCDAFGLDRVTLAPELRAMLPPEPSYQPAADLALIDGYQFLTEPYNHQRRGLAELLEHDRWGLFWEMGVGKSKVVADRLRQLYGSGWCGTALILCPKSVLSVWPEQLMIHAGLSCTVFSGTPLQRGNSLKVFLHSMGRKSEAIAVMNYDLLPWLLKYTTLQLGFGIVVADECQYIKNLTAKRSNLTRKIAANARYRYALSGTPAPNGPADWFGVLSFLNPNILGSESKTALTARYCLMGEAPNGGRMVVGYRNLSDLNRRVASVCSRVKKEDCLDLPPKVFSERRCVLSGEQSRVYNTLKRDAVARLVKAREDSTLTLQNVLTESLRLLQVVGGHVPDDTGRVMHFQPNAKMDLLCEVLEECSNEQVVVWCSFLEEIFAVAEELANAGKSTVSFYGDLDGRERCGVLERFRSGGAQYLIATPQSGGMGITLVNAAVEIFYSRTYNWAHYAQAIDRLHRPGQQRSVTVLSLVAEGTVDQRVTEALERKEKTAEWLMSRPVEEML